MLAPPDRRRKKLERRRAANRRRKAEQRARGKAGLHRCTLWISGQAYEGLLRQLIHNGQLTDSQANDHHQFELALSARVERQGKEWAL
jgi:hypothetical protein